MYAIYKNKGTLDIRAFTVMGINAKPNSDSPIGYFGTGLKYAMAVLARHGCTVEVQPGYGKSPYMLKTQHATFREKEFTELQLHTKETGATVQLPFTTELGKNWELWMVLRELESNMRDEGGEFELTPQRPQPTNGEVRIIVSGEPFINTVINKRKNVFFDLAVEGNHVEKFYDFDVVMKSCDSIFYRGVNVGSYEKPLSCAFNIKEKLDLTEDRTVRYDWAVGRMLRDNFLQATPAIQQHMLDRPQMFDWELMLRNASVIYECEMSEATRNLVLLHHRRTGNVPRILTGFITEMELKAEMATDALLGDDEEVMLREATARLIEMGYNVDDYPIKVRSRLAGEALGMADRSTKTIYLAKRCFTDGLENVMGTLLEEYCHLSQDVDDESRKMQDWLLRQAIRQGQRFLNARKDLRRLQDERTRTQ